MKNVKHLIIGVFAFILAVSAFATNNKTKASGDVTNTRGYVTQDNFIGTYTWGYYAPAVPMVGADAITLQQDSASNVYLQSNALRAAYASNPSSIYNVEQDSVNVCYADSDKSSPDSTTVTRKISLNSGIGWITAGSVAVIKTGTPLAVNCIKFQNIPGVLMKYTLAHTNSGSTDTTWVMWAKTYVVKK